VSCGVGCRCCSDPALLWLWGRPAATALIRPPVWEPPYAVGAALKRPKKKKEKEKKKLSLVFHNFSRRILNYLAQFFFFLFSSGYFKLIFSVARFLVPEFCQV